MKGKYKTLLALVLILILLVLTLLLTLAQWLPLLAGIWLPPGTRIAIASSPYLSRDAIIIPELRYLANECELAMISNATLNYSGFWQLHLDKLNINADCISKISSSERASVAPKSLAQWQSLLPHAQLTIDHVNILPWSQSAGALNASFSPIKQEIHYHSSQLVLEANLKERQLRIERLMFRASQAYEPIELTGDIALPFIPDSWPQQGKIETILRFSHEPQLIKARLTWKKKQGDFTLYRSQSGEELVSLPWRIGKTDIVIDNGQWRWPWSDVALNGGITLRVNHWAKGLENATVSGRVNMLTQGKAGKANAVLNIGPGKLSMQNSALPLRLTGEAKYRALVFYASLPAELSGAVTAPRLRFFSGALLRSRGRIIDALDIDEIRWPLAGVSVTQSGIEGRLQAILRAHENRTGKFVLHLDGKASDFLPDVGLWRWRYWGKGTYSPMNARWDVSGKGEWHDDSIKLSSLSTGFDQLQYGSMRVDTPRLVLNKPVIWKRAVAHESFNGTLSLNTGNTHFSAGSKLPPATLIFAISGNNPSSFQFKGNLHAEKIGPVRINGRWDGERLRGSAWWPPQPLNVFQPLLPPALKMTFEKGQLYAQVAFSAAAGRGFEAGGHGVIKAGGLLLPDNQFNGIDFIVPFRFSQSRWRLGTHGPVTLRIDEINNQLSMRQITAELQGWYPWSDEQPLLLSNVSARLAGGQISMQQLRMPQRDAALIRLHHLSLSELITAIHPKQFALSGQINGALPLWLTHPQWIVKDGWVANAAPLTLRLDKDMADAIVKNNMAAGAGINWLRYMEISRAWAMVNINNLGEMTLRANLQGTSQVDKKRTTVKLNYHHEENLFTLWRSLRFGDNLQVWLEQKMAVESCHYHEKECKKIR